MLKSITCVTQSAVSILSSNDSMWGDQLFAIFQGAAAERWQGAAYKSLLSIQTNKSWHSENAYVIRLCKFDNMQSFARGSFDGLGLAALYLPTFSLTAGKWLSLRTYKDTHGLSRIECAMQCKQNNWKVYNTGCIGCTVCLYWCGWLDVLGLPMREGAFFPWRGSFWGTSRWCTNVLSSLFDLDGLFLLLICILMF